MKTVFFILTLLLISTPLKAQKTVHIQGQLNNLNENELLYVGTEEGLKPLNISDDGSFNVEIKTPHLPSFFSIEKVSKRGKVKQVIQRIWFEEDSVIVTINLADKTFQIQTKTPHQSISEKIEKQKGRKRLKLIQENINYLPGLYFAEREKENFSINNLKALRKQIDPKHENLIYVKKLDKYIEAKSRKPIKKGVEIEDFTLPDSIGENKNILSINDNLKLIAVLSSGCYFSMKSISFLEKLNESQIKIISIWADKSKDTWQNYQSEKKKNITWLNLWDEYEFATTYLNVKSYPTFFVLDKNGILTEIIEGYSDKSVEKINSLVGEER